jgi:hypothetical protein
MPRRFREVHGCAGQQPIRYTIADRTRGISSGGIGAVHALARQVGLIDAEVDRALAVCFRGGFRQVLLRGDTDFAKTEHLDRWDAAGHVHFLFGYDAAPNLIALAEQIPEKYW